MKTSRLSVFALALLSGACLPTAPSPVYECLTQPRYYYLPNGDISVEIDRYTQSTPCPLRRID